jgi:N-acetyl-alpha-D-muramate 1-phosphate uridylyltransferase
MQCVILAGGLGTRMRDFGEADHPKALLPVHGRPFVDHQLELLAARGIADVVFCIGHGGTALQGHVGNGAGYGLAIRYVDEGDDLRGTAGALRLALDEGVLDEAFAVLYGDSYLPIDLEPVWRAFGDGGLPALMTVFRNENRWEPSNAVLDEGRVVLYDKRREHPRSGECRWIDYGLSVLRAELIEQRVPASKVTDLADLFHELSLEGKLAGFEVEERFYEVGSPHGLAELERYIAGLNRT